MVQSAEIELRCYDCFFSRPRAQCFLGEGGPNAVEHKSQLGFGALRESANGLLSKLFTHILVGEPAIPNYD